MGMMDIRNFSVLDEIDKSVNDWVNNEKTDYNEKFTLLRAVKELYETNNLKINPRGGLIGSGHPLGATGIAQTIEVTQQLQTNANSRQVDSAKLGLVHNMSAAATSSTILVLER